MTRQRTARPDNTKRRKRCQDFHLLAWALLLAVIIGCGSNDSPSGPSNEPKVMQACDLMPRAEVEAIIGAPVDDPRKTHHNREATRPWLSICNYYADAKQIGIGITVMPHGRNATGQQAFAQYEAGLKQGLGDNFELAVVSGIGDYAGWDGSTKQLTVFKGPYMVIVGIISPTVKGDTALELNRRLAEKILTKL